MYFYSSVSLNQQTKAVYDYNLQHKQQKICKDNLLQSTVKVISLKIVILTMEEKISFLNSTK